MNLEKKTGLDWSAISRIENGKRGFNEQNLVVFADFFKVSTDYILGRSDVVQTKIIEKPIFTNPLRDTDDFKYIIDFLNTCTREEIFIVKGTIFAIRETEKSGYQYNKYKDKSNIS